MRRFSTVAQYAVAFDMNTASMREDGYTQSEITSVYQKEIRDALWSCGFTAHPQGSLYCTEKEQDPIAAIMKLQSTLKSKAPMFCKYVNRVHVFRMEEWSDVTELIADRPSAPEPLAEEEVDEQEYTLSSITYGIQ